MSTPTATRILANLAKPSAQPKTGCPCLCKRGQQRDNCRHCEGTGMLIDFAALRARPLTHHTP